MLKSRSGSQGNSSATPPQTIEVVRRRARHRLIGAAILVLVGVLGFPLLFDTEPRPVAGDIPIEIPSRGDATPLAKAEPVSASQEKASADLPAEEVRESAVSARESLDAREEVVEPSGVDTAAKSAPKPVVPPSPVEREVVQDTVKDTKSDSRAKEAKAAKEAKEAKEAKDKETRLAAAAKAKSSAADSARAKALLESKTPAGTERFVVQVGAFAEAGSARATRLKLERAGLTTYTNVAKTSGGDLIRVRVGPFNSRADVDKAAAKVKALGLPARILTL